MLQDLRYALRQLHNRPGFSIVAVLTLALGIGANTAVFSIFDQVMLQSMPVHAPGGLVLLKEHSQTESGGLHSHGDEALYFSYPAYREVRDHNDVFSGMLASAPFRAAITSRDTTEQTWGELVSGNYFDVLGMHPAIGRLLTPHDDTPGKGNPVAVLSYEYWQTHLAADPGVLQRVIHLNGQAFTIAGVAAPGYHGLSPEEVPTVFVPISLEPLLTFRKGFLDNPRERWLNILARLRPDVSRIAAQSAMDVRWHAIRQSELAQIPSRSARFDQEFMNTHLSFVDGAAGLPMLRNDFGTPLTALMGMVLAVLLIACGNVANLLLVRAAGRKREMAVRSALGASRRRIFSQVMMEGLVLGVVAALAGALLGAAGVSLLVGSIPEEAGVGGAISPDLDARVLAFTLCAGLFTCLLFSLAPAIAGTRSVLADALHDRGNSGCAGGSRFRSALVSCEVMLSLVLLVVAGLFVRTLDNMKAVNPGFNTGHLLTFTVNARLLGKTPADTKNEYERILDTVRGQPGVRGASYALLPLLSDEDAGGTVRIAGYTPKEDEALDFRMNSVAPDFFAALKIPLLAGRVFSDHDSASTQKVGIINETFARKFFGSPQAALDHVFCFGCKKAETPDTRIVGVVSDSKHSGLRDKPAPFFYLTYSQMQGADAATFYLRTAQDPDAIAASIRKSVREIDSNLPVQSLESMTAHIESGLFQQRLISSLAGAFGIVAAILAAIGLYGVLAYSVTQRTQEIGIRVALGANVTEVMGLVLRQVLIMVGAGIVIGVPVSTAVTQLVRSELYGISSTDPVVFAAVSALLILIAAIAAFLPARRAATVDAMHALRVE